MKVKNKEYFEKQAEEFNRIANNAKQIISDKRNKRIRLEKAEKILNKKKRL